jgi:Tfp pilus assembly protein PilP
MKKYWICLACVFLVACKKEATNDVNYYLSHGDERRAKLMECANNPGDSAITANCVNAKEAQHKSQFDTKNAEMPSIR